jgi:hypothetical protein
MKTTVETQSGSIYELDNVKMTWRRSFENTGLSGVLRSDGGEMSSFPAIKLDKPMTIQGPPFASHAVARFIVTTPVVRISHEATGFAKGQRGHTAWGLMAGLAAGGKRAVDQAGSGCAAIRAHIRASCNGEPATTDEAKAAANDISDQRNDGPSCTLCGATMIYRCLSCGSTPEPTIPKIQDCTRPAPHVCGRSGPCNGWPLTRKQVFDAVSESSAIGSNRTPRVTSEQADGCDHPKSVGYDGWICVRFYRP